MPNGARTSYRGQGSPSPLHTSDSEETFRYKKRAFFQFFKKKAGYLVSKLRLIEISRICTKIMFLVKELNPYGGLNQHTSLLQYPLGNRVNYFNYMYEINGLLSLIQYQYTQ